MKKILSILKLVAALVIAMTWYTPNTLYALTPEASKTLTMDADGKKGFDFYEKGDYDKAIEFFEKSAKNGTSVAMTYLGSMYEEGKGVDEDLSKALEWYEKAGEIGNPNGMVSAGYIYVREKDYDNAVYWFEKAAELEHPTAVRMMGSFYENGNGVECNIEKAEEYYKKAIELGDSYAQKNLDELKKNGGKSKQASEPASTPAKTKQDSKKDVKASTSKEKETKKEDSLVEEGIKELMDNNDAEAALKLFEKADKAGDLDGSFFAGYVLDWVLEEGKGQDYEKARAYYNKCVDVNPAANISLFFNYYYGQGIKPDEKKAMQYANKANELLKKSEEMPSTRGIYERIIASFYITDDIKYTDKEKAINLIEKSAEEGNIDSMYTIGSYYFEGIGLEQNYKKALEWYEKSAELGNWDAIKAIAFMYINGVEVKKDGKTALEWYEKAANEGDYASMCLIGDMYSRGDGVKKDYKKALEWYEKSAELGWSHAYVALANLYMDGTGVKTDYKKAKEMLEKAIEIDNNMFALSNLGYMYDCGLGMDVDYEKAMDYYLLAAEQGVGGAMENIGNLYLNGAGVEKSKKKADEWYAKAKEAKYQ